MRKNKKKTTLAQEADTLFVQLFPICRSLTGDGVRQTLQELQQVTPFSLHSVASGTECYDWTVPDEWNIRDAYIADESGKRIIDFKNSTIHVVSYSVPIQKTMSFAELKPHLYYLENLPDAIPYRTSYYNRDWGFCLTYTQYKTLDRDAKYTVCIDATLQPGELVYGEQLLPGSDPAAKEILISAYCCHPSLANDSLSGVILWALLLRELKKKQLRNSYRFVLVPETIGAIAYLHQHEAAMRSIDCGFVLTTVAGPGKIGYKETFQANSYLDRVVKYVFAEANLDAEIYPFDGYGSDEIRYSSPFFRIPVGTISKDKYYEYEYYHTSLDNLDFVAGKYLVETLAVYLRVIEIMEKDQTYVTQFPHVEPMLGKRGLYPSVGGTIKQAASSTSHTSHSYSLDSESVISGTQLDALKWLLFLCDGSLSLFEVAEQRKLPFSLLQECAELLTKHQVLKRKE